MCAARARALADARQLEGRYQCNKRSVQPHKLAQCRVQNAAQYRTVRHLKRSATPAQQNATQAWSRCNRYTLLAFDATTDYGALRRAH
jgi:hypothetical protein